jgi:hypothetical protein
MASPRSTASASSIGARSYARSSPSLSTAGTTINSSWRSIGAGSTSVVSLREYAQYDFAEKGVESCLRLSPHYYNTVEEVAQVVSAVAEITAGGARPGT